MNASEYNAKQYSEGELTEEMITEMVEFWQRGHDLSVDGYCGPNTINTLQTKVGEVVKYFPLLLLPDGRAPVITSGFYTENPSRSTHKGVDFFYKWNSDDPDMPTGDGGAIEKRGKRKWWIPEGTCAVSAAAGVVQKAENSRTGYKVWVDHGNGERTGYFHLQNCLVEPGQKVPSGTALGLIGDNPAGHDATHLHFEVSPVDRYAPMNPRRWLDGAIYLDA